MNLLNLFRDKPQFIEIQQAPTQLPLKVLKPAEELPSIGKRNEKIIEAITVTRKVAVELARSGFHVIDIEVSTRNPRIIINPCKSCAKLEGAMIRVSRLSNIIVKTWAANIEGVQVEWMVPDHG